MQPMKRKFKAIIVYRLDRISRNISDFASLIEELARLDISLFLLKSSSIQALLWDEL